MKNREREIETLTAGDKRRKVLKKAAAGVLIALAVLTVLCGAALFGGWLWFRESVEKAEFDPALLPTATALPVVLDRHGNELAYAADNFIEPGSLPRRVTDAFVALEDKRFYSHKGYDPKGMLRAVIKNIGAGRTVEGASTITQQLVKNTHLSAERTLERKLKEIAIAAKIEQNYSKDEILSMYLSVIYFGSGAYGIKEASRVYFGCAPEELTVAQAATLAGILKNPAEYSPKNHPENAVARRDLVLDVMYREGCLTAAERDEAKAEELVLAETPEERDPAARYVAEAVREACELLGITEYELGNSGLTVLTAYDPSAQSALVRETENAAVYSSPEVDGEAVLIDNATGEIVAYHNTTGYEVRRQAGSAMKPLAVYAPALDAGVITLATPVRDELTDFGGWQPQNFGGNHLGDITPREALKRSVNTVAVKVLSYLGAGRAAEKCRMLGLPLTSEDENLALALGSTQKGVSPVELAGAYSALAREGNFIEPHFVRAVVKDGARVAAHPNTATRVFSPDASALVTDCLVDTVRDGTARTLSSLPFEVAAKTGTVERSDGVNTDAWSVSYTTEATLAVWHGGTDMTELGGGHPTRHAANIWKTICSEEIPAPFALPRTVVKKRVDAFSTFSSGKTVLALPGTPEKYVFEELFSSSRLPDAEGSRFLSALPEFTLAADGGSAVLTLTAEEPFLYAIYCADALGERRVALLDGETGALLDGYDEADGASRENPTSNGIFFGQMPRSAPAGSREVSVLETEKVRETSRFPALSVTLSHTPFSFGDKVSYTVEVLSKESGKPLGSAEKSCFPSAFLPFRSRAQ